MDIVKLVLLSVMLCSAVLEPRQERHLVGECSYREGGWTNHLSGCIGDHSQDGVHREREVGQGLGQG